MNRFLTAACFVLVLCIACDQGLEPPPPRPPSGAIKGIVTYEGTWPPADSLRDLRFVAFRIIPASVSDFTDINNLVYTPRGLKRNVEADTFLIPDVMNGNYPYCGVAQQFGGNVFRDWRPVSLYPGPFNSGITIQGDTARITIHVKWGGPYPPFPPQQKVEAGS